MGSIYYQEIFSKKTIDKDKKLENIPIWEFIEIITFGELVKFYEFLKNKYNIKNKIEDIHILKDIVRLRNAVYHNTNILTNLKDKDNNYPPKYKIVKFLKEIGIKEKIRNNKLSNSRIRQITYTLYMFNEIVTSKKIKYKTKKQLKKFFYKRIKT